MLLTLMYSSGIDFCSFISISRKSRSVTDCLNTGKECCSSSWVFNNINYYACFNYTHITNLSPSVGNFNSTLEAYFFSSVDLTSISSYLIRCN